MAVLATVHCSRQQCSYPKRLYSFFSHIGSLDVGFLAALVSVMLRSWMIEAAARSLKRLQRRF
jgi:hypothetical protein